MSIDPRYYGLIEMGMTFGLVGLFTVQQLWSLRDRPGDNKDAVTREDDDGPPAPPPGD